MYRYIRKFILFSVFICCFIICLLACQCKCCFKNVIYIIVKYQYIRILLNTKCDLLNIVLNINSVIY